MANAVTIPLPKMLQFFGMLREQGCIPIEEHIVHVEINGDLSTFAFTDKAPKETVTFIMLKYGGKEYHGDL